MRKTCIYFICICLCVRYTSICHLSIPIVEAAFGRLHNGGPAAFGRRPTVVESVMGDGKVANISKT